MKFLIMRKLISSLGRGDTDPVRIPAMLGGRNQNSEYIMRSDAARYGK